jgi:hypothetical protein
LPPGELALRRRATKQIIERMGSGVKFVAANYYCQMLSIPHSTLVLNLEMATAFSVGAYQFSDF